MADEHVSRTYVVENAWKCAGCGHQNLGRDLKCQNCGATKHKGDADQMVAGSPEVTDRALLQMANAGANWVCQFCGSQSRNTDGTCKNCGSKSEEAPKQTIAEQVADGGPPASAAGSSRPGKRTAYYVVGGLVVVGILGAVLLVPHKVGAKVVGVHWDYEIDVKQRSLSHGQGYDVPAGATNTSCQDRTTTEKQDCNPHDCNCHDKTINKGNGFTQVQHVCSTCFDKCDKATVRKWCSYDTYDWRTVNSLRDSGEGHDVRWPAAPQAGFEQRLDRVEKYAVEFEDGKSKYSYSPSNLSDFQRYNLGDSWSIKVNAAKMVTPEARQ